MASQKIDINTAGLDELESLIGVGSAKAEAIIEVRKTSGGFSELSDLLKIAGVGPCLLELNRAVLECTVRPSTSSANTKNTAPQSTRKRERETRSSKNDVSKPEDKVTESTLRLNQVRSRTERSRIESTARPPLTRSSRHLAYRDNRQSSSEDSDQDVETRGQSETVTEADTKPHVENTNDEGTSNVSKTQPTSVAMVTRDSCDEEEVKESKVELLTRTRIMSTSEKHWMKRKCESGGSKGHSPGKKPCRLGDNCHDSSEDEGEATLAQALRSSTSTAASMRKQKIPSRSNPPPELAAWLTTFQMWSHAERLLALDRLMEQCEPTQVRHVMGVIEPQFQRDFISLLPKELALYVLSFLDPRHLLQAAQTCRYWCILAEDNLLWREKCQEESIDEELVYGAKLSSSVAARRSSSKGRSGRSYSGCSKGGPPWKALYMRQVQIERNWRSAPLPTPELLKGHDDHVITCLEFCGNRIVSGSDDNTLKVWSAVTGKCLRTLVGHTGGVWSSQMSDSVVISGSTDRTLKVWNVDTGQCVHTLYGHTSTVRCMHLCGNIVVSGSRDATLRMWDISSGQCVHVLMGHVAAVRCVQYDGRRVVSGAYDYMVKVWDPDTETCLHTLQGHSNRVYSLQFDGVHIVSGSLDTSIRVWDVESGNCLHTLIGHQSLTSGMELKDNTLVSGNADSTVKVWDITTGQCLQTLQGANKHQSAVTCLQFNKRFVITSSDDGTVKIWDVKTGEFLRNLVALDSGGSGGVVWRIRCSNTRLVCAVGSRNGTEETKLMVLNFDIDDDAGIASPQQPSSPDTAAVSS